MTLSPELCRAGRALLAWSQRRLAEEAQTAISTVADFERGARTPIANSVDALTKTLENGGVRFTGEQASLAAASAPESALAEGQPFRLINSGDLLEWASRLDGRSGLPELIDRLVLAGAGPDTMRHFPAGESTQAGGWDGTCDSPRPVANRVPIGKSGWELTVNGGIDKKADGDFKKREEALDQVTRQAMTFVFVVMRNWPGKDVWSARQRARGIFADVMALDVDDLVHWLDEHPGVQLWLAERIGKMPRTGIESLKEAWERFALATVPPLPEAVLLAGRDDEATRVHAWLNAPASVLTVHASTNEEASAFLWSALSVLPADVRESYRLRTIVARTEDAARELSRAMRPMIIVMHDDDPGFAKSIAAKAHYVYAIARNRDRSGVDVTLGPVHRYELEEALMVGVRESGVGVDLLRISRSRGEARSLAKRAGGSVAILRRILAKQTMPPPSWVGTTSKGVLSALLLTGAWDESYEGDRALVERLATQPYDDVARELEPLTAGIDAPVIRSGTKLRWVSRLDAWFLLAPALTKTDLVAFFDGAEVALREIDPRFDDVDRSRMIAYGEQKPGHSREVRAGLAEAIDVMAVHPEEAPPNLHIDSRVEEFVRVLLDHADGALWWSLRAELPALAEAAPDQFLDGLDASLDAPDAPVTVLLKSDEGVFSRDYISDLTSALERLAWAPAYFARAVAVLARLAERDTRDNRHGNRPTATLRQIFLPWTPQTYVSLEDRLTCLDMMRSDANRAAWDLMLSILPKGGGDHSSDSSQPIWRRVEEGAQEFPTQELMQRSADEVFERLLADVGSDVERWNEFFKNVVGLTHRQQERMARTFLDVAREIVDERTRVDAREFVRGVLNRHRESSSAWWAMPEPVLGLLQEAFDLLAPTSLVERDGWVFANHPKPPVTNAGHDLYKMLALNDENQLRVARELIEAADIELIFEMASAVENPVALGTALMKTGFDDPVRPAIVERACRSEDYKLREFGRGLVLGAVEVLGSEWAAGLVRDAVAAGWSAEAIAVVLRGMPFNTVTIRVASEAGENVDAAYWQSVPWMFMMHASLADRVVAVEQLLRVDRPVEAVALIGQTGPKDFPSSLQLRAMEAASSQIGCVRGGNDSSMLGHYCGLILDRLEADPSIDRVALFRLEWTYYGFLQNSGREPKLLETGLAESPDFFLTVVSSIYRGDDDDTATAADEDPERRAAIATQSYMLLDSWKRVPGSEEDGQIDEAALMAWVNTVRAGAAVAKRSAIVDQQIGTILAAAKPDANGEWPPKAVREAIERTKSREIERGFELGVRNGRGVTTRGPLDGGELERGEKRRFEELAKRYAITAPRTAAALRAIAKSYGIDGVYMDQISDSVGSV